MLYSKMQDSIVGLTGLKLITLSDKGVFRQADSIATKGKWGLANDSTMFIQRGGRGFENFTAHFNGYKKGILQLTEWVDAGGEKIKLIWHLKKIGDSESAADLFSDKRNEWRKKPAQPESEKQIRERLASMLQYYADYYWLVTKESSFFVPTRVILPMRFYQHAIGMKDFNEESFFATLFYDKKQANDAHRYLSLTIKILRNDFPNDNSYVKEYAAFMEKMAKEIVKD